ncbi:MAG: DUF1365 domain-containing protein [Coriobacteriia bacterium]|nr:DUF1365 domain-containing protein [Coriobacteriia bacterium]
MNSRLYEGSVMHARSRPAKNSFRYRIWFAYLDLAELEDLGRTVSGFGHDARAWAVFRNRDHGPRDGSPLRAWIDRVLAQAGIDLAGGVVRILTMLRGGPFGFYPVSFWYCFGADGTLRAVLAEVQNTFGGHHNYLLHEEGGAMEFGEDLFAPKLFHVSPFMPMDARYRFRFTMPGETLSASIHEDIEGAPTFVAGINLTEHPFDDVTLSRLNRTYISMPLRAWLLIHFQAIRLAAKRVGFFSDPGAPDEETTIDPQRVLRDGAD